MIAWPWVAAGAVAIGAVALAPRKINAAGAIFRLRPLSTDRYVIREIFEEDTYQLNVTSLPDAPTIVDIGANIGAFSVRCAQLWPDAVITCAEVDANNAAACRENIAPFHQITLIEAAIRGNKIPTGHACRFAKNGMCKTTYAAGEPIYSLTLQELIDSIGHQSVDLLKIDVEGAEHDILNLALSDSTLSRVGYIIGEWHEREDGNADTIDKTLSSADFVGVLTYSGPHHGMFFAKKRGT